jgi:hypothetical protein
MTCAARIRVPAGADPPSRHRGRRAPTAGGPPRPDGPVRRAGDAAPAGRRDAEREARA